MLLTLAIAGYRSLRDLRLPLDRLNVVTGANGSGKSSLYRALRLMADIAHGRIVSSLAQEGGLSAALWAGPETIAASVRRGEHAVEGLRRKKPIALRLGFAAEDYGYAMDLGYPPNPGFAGHEQPSMFGLDPEIKLEALWIGEALSRTNLIAERRGPSVRIRDAEGGWAQTSTTLPAYDSMLTHIGDPRTAAELDIMRERMRNWRFYDHFRTDRDAPARRPGIGTRTPVLGADGADLAAAIQTIREIGRGDAFDAAITDAFPGAAVEIDSHGGLFELSMRQHGLLRALSAAELSDGTLRYLLLVAALLSPRPPSLMVLNEPETSLHADLVAPLARLIADASTRSQIIVVSHDAALVSALEAASARRIVLHKDFGETQAAFGEDEMPKWNWPAR